MMEDDFESLDEYWATMGAHGCTYWGGEMEIKALAHALRRQIIVYNDQALEATVTHGSEYVTYGGEPMGPIRLLFSRNNHFEALKPTEAQQQQLTAVEQLGAYRRRTNGSRGDHQRH